MEQIVFLQSHLCQTYLAKLLEVMGGYDYESKSARDLCLMNFKMLELYSL